MGRRIGGGKNGKRNLFAYSFLCLLRIVDKIDGADRKERGRREGEFCWAGHFEVFGHIPNSTKGRLVCSASYRIIPKVGSRSKAEVLRTPSVKT